MEKLKELLKIPGLSGYESKIIEFLKKEFTNFGYSYKRDNLGSIIFFKKNNNKNSKIKKVVIDAHIDEVGFLITNLNDDGTVIIESIGGINLKFMQTQTFEIWDLDFKNKYLGILTFPNQDDKNLDLEKAILDLGFRNKKDLLNHNINIGSSVTFPDFFQENEKSILAKSIDNRLGTYIALNIAKDFAKKDLKFDLQFIFSVQEEVGLRGARTAIYNQNPDLVIVVDISPAYDIDQKGPPYGILGEGTMLRHKDVYTIYKKEVIVFLRNLFERNNIKYQDYFSFGGTNAGIIQLIKEGIFVLPFGLCARNIHTSLAIVDKKDLLETEKGLRVLINKMNENLTKKGTLLN
ncbi:/ pepA / Glutamyl aminopeptidase /:76009 Forward [Candidatus Hepatoplasma crinochetorum]|uniref:/ pepA / Glutamyl aminopeptidase /:76009 Forward n=1 Tax=Candidatus Hepatoplasma crinochetorum TaxID=295596 RepID=A0A0G7ZNB2_9MOLU|nr:/ pepA / Glutamyl aminopeptidase /:76009 Forward [Candidatus Hepatoplasma crinochetorum]